MEFLTVGGRSLGRVNANQLLAAGAIVLLAAIVVVIVVVDF